MSKIKQCANAPLTLRNIADQMESGELDCEEVTVIAGLDIFHCGGVDDSRAVENAVFNMTMGIQILMRPVVDLAADAEET